MNDERNQNPVAIAGDLAAKLMAGIAQSRATTQIGAGGKDILRMLKSGEWVFGQSNEEVQQGSRWVVNPLSLAHGWVCWKEGKLAGEKMASMMEYQPTQPDPIGGTPYKEQRSFDLKCLDGDDAGHEVIYKISSYGGVKATTQLIGAIQPRLTTPYPCPVVTLGHLGYDHGTFGWIENPIFTIVGWSDMNGNVEDTRPAVASNGPVASTTAAPTSEPAPAPAPPPRKRKAPLGAAPAATVAAAPAPAPTPAPQPAPQPAAVRPEPAPTAAAHTGQRRRPGAR